MPEPPKVLIVLLSYKPNLDWLNQAITSIRLQSRAEWRLAVMDSTPADHPEKAAVLGLVQGHAEDDHRLGWEGRIVAANCEWVPYADVARKVNYAAQNYAEGCEYVVVMSDDDYVAPRFLEVQAGMLDKDPKAGFAQGGVHLFGTTEDPKRSHFGFWLHDLPLDKQLVDQIGQNQFAGTCVMRLKPFLEYGGYDTVAVPEGFPVGLEDFNMFMQFLRHGWRYAVSRELLLFARQRPEQNNRRVYGTPLYTKTLLAMCRKQGIDVAFNGNGGFSIALPGVAQQATT